MVQCIIVACQFIITFRVKHSRNEMYITHGRLCVYVCLSVCRSPHSHTTGGPGCNFGNCRGSPLVVQYWAMCNRCTGFVAMTTHTYISL